VAAMVHHGGIGTTGQLLTAGVPQLVVPMSFDQPDNAYRVECLGVGRSIRPREYVAENVASELGQLLGDGDIYARCQDLAAKCAETQAVRVACDAIEGLVGKRVVTGNEVTSPL
jgi:rhamnosyltransferase subunit B